MRVSFDNEADRFPTLSESGLIADSLRRVGIPLNTRCGQRGVCQGCEVDLVSGEFEENGRHHNPDGSAPVRVRGCQTRPLTQGGHIHVPVSSRLETKAQIDDSFVVHAFHRGRVIQAPLVTLRLPGLEEGATDWMMLEEALGTHFPGVVWEAPTSQILSEFSRCLHESADRVLRPLVEVRGDRGWLDAFLPLDGCGQLLGLAVDIGTTTVAGILVDLSTGDVLARGSIYNQQITLADDVASRIMASESHGPGELRRLVVEESINVITRSMLGEVNAEKEAVVAAVIAGNTVMSHLFLSLSPSGIGKIPFQPLIRDYPRGNARETGLEIHPAASVRVLPSISGYIGGDLVADIYVSGLLGNPGLTLLVDIGTNGEIILSEGGRLLGCATAAGPAFEGSWIQCGCRAIHGAIEIIRIDEAGKVTYETIGNGKPLGICGSGIVDFIAEAFRAGFLNEMGRLEIDRVREAGCYRLIEKEGSYGSSTHAFVVVGERQSATGKEIVVTERDIAEVLKAKGAIYAGMQTLLEVAGHEFADLDRLVLAEGFARHLDLASAVWMGLLPELEPSRFEVIGNGSLAGAYMALVEESSWPSYQALGTIPKVVELNKTETFEDNYVSALCLPNLDDSAFPGIHIPPRRATKPCAST
jgi:uncharacterized 2Fe-2S/4Fe-4S cluster protein (DUF4445 family)